MSGGLSSGYCRKGAGLIQTSGMEDDTHILTLEGELDMHHAQTVRARLQPVLNAKTKRVLVNLHDVSYMDSSGLALFIEALQKVQGYGGKLALFGMGQSLMHIFQIARLDQVFQLFADEASARAGT